MTLPAVLARPTLSRLPSLALATAPQEAPPNALGLIQAIIESLMGRRPLHQIRPYLSGRAFEHLSSKVDTGQYRRLQVGRIRTQMPYGGAVEACAQLWLAGRSLSCVLRLDARRRAWVCTELTLLEPAAMLAAA